eukprot:scaffold35015_cov107-Isochrysis_galbana.AAC.2
MSTSLTLPLWAGLTLFPSPSGVEVEVERAAGSEETRRNLRSQMKSHERPLKMRGWMLKPAMYQSKPVIHQSNFRENASIFSSAKSQTKIEAISQTTE